MKKKLNPSVASSAATTPGPLCQMEAQKKTARRSSSATDDSLSCGKSFRSPIVAPTATTAAGYPTHRGPATLITPAILTASPRHATSMASPKE